MLLYPVRDKAGEIPISLTSTGGMLVSAVDTAGNNGELDIGTVSIAGTGRAIVETGANDQFGNTVLGQDNAAGTFVGATTGVATTAPTSAERVTAASLAASGAGTDATDEYLVLTGPTTINVLNVTATGDPVAILNTTKGELVSVTAPAIGTLQTLGNLGFPTPEATPAVEQPIAVIINGNQYPFLDQHYGVTIGTGIVPTAGVGFISNQAGTGDALAILVGGGVANVDVGGTLQTLVANSGGLNEPGQVDGIDGPVEAGRILYTDIGQGIGFRGTGLASGGGLYATDVVGLVTNLGNPGANIRGSIIAGEQTTTALTTTLNDQAINEIDLVNGSLIDAQVFDLFGASFIEASDLSPITRLVSGFTQAPFNNPYTYDIGTIAVSGAGGIIGTDIEATDVGNVIVANGGFGILESIVGGAGEGRILNVSASGYGIRDTYIGNSGYIGTIAATGNGNLVPTTAYPLAVRPSDATESTIEIDGVPFQIDAATGMEPFADTDINAALGVTGANGNESDVTDTGVIEDDTIAAKQNLGELIAYRIRTAEPTFLQTTIAGEADVPNIPVVGTTFANSVTIGSTVGLIKVYDTIDGLQVTAGSVTKVQVNSNVSRLGISSAGTIGSLIVHGNLGTDVNNPATQTEVPDSYIDATGPAGAITTATIYGSLFANVDVVGRIGNMTVNGDIYGSLTDQGHVIGTDPNNVSADSVNTLRVTGNIRDGSVSIAGTVNNLFINGGLGAAGGALTIAGGVNHLTVGASRKKGAQLALDLTVNGTVQQMTVFGEITGAVDILGDLRTLSLTNDGTTADAITSTGSLTVGGRLYKATITNGNVAGDVTVTGDLYTLNVVRGSILAGATISSTLASIHTVHVTGGGNYGVDGSIVAANGTGLNVTVTGSVGDGTDAATLSALSAGTISIGGDVNADATVATIGELDNLIVGGSIQTGATVSGHPIGHYRVRGTTTGTLVTS